MPTSLRRTSLCLFIAAGAALLAGSGCDRGIKKLTVSGTVEYKGQRLSTGLLQFVGPDGAYSASVIQPDGTYIMTDVLPGETKIGVMSTPQGTGSSGGNSAPGPKAKAIDLPDKFRNADTSGVKYTITPETKELHIDLK